MTSQQKNHRGQAQTSTRRGPRVTVIDLGISNTHSVANALRSLGADVSIAMHGKEITRSQRLILPGVGAFREGIERLHERGFATVLRRHQQDGTPLLGICLGMQLLFTDGSEFGPAEGLGLIAGHVRAIPRPALRRSPVKIPHVGWDVVALDRRHPLLSGLGESFYGYFLHSFRALPTNPDDCWATCTYGPHSICAVAGNGSVMGTQFHPEKSGPAGLQILQNFIDIPVSREEAKHARDQLPGVRAS